MNVSLTPELAEFIRRKLASGMYKNAAEVVREGLRLLAERDRRDTLRDDELRARIEEGIRSADEGPLLDGEEVFARLDARLRKLEEQRPRE